MGNVLGDVAGSVDGSVKCYVIIKRLEEELMMPKPDWEKFGMSIMANWPTGDVEGGELQYLAVENHILLPVEGGYDPDNHDDEHGCAEPGDPWFVYNYVDI